MTVVSDIQELSPTALIELFELDLTNFGDTKYYFHAGTNELNQDIVWQGITYNALPIQASGFDLSIKGEIPRPSFIVSNILGIMGAFISSFNDLIGAKVTRIRTFKKYLDAVNFPNNTNPDANPVAEFPRDVYFINRKVQETRSLVEFELVSVWDMQGIMLPRRQIIQNICMWKYRGAECGYTGGPVADENDNPTTDSTKDKCSKSINGCILRFGANANLPYGGFPGAGNY